jgi:hypothetical protein
VVVRIIPPLIGEGGEADGPLAAEREEIARALLAGEN